MIAPGVLDKEEFIAIVDTVANGKNNIVDALATSTGDDASLVSLESHFVSLNIDCNWPFCKCKFELTSILGSNINQLGDFSYSFGFIIMACSSTGALGIVHFVFKWVFFGILKNFIN